MSDGKDHMPAGKDFFPVSLPDPHTGYFSVFRYKFRHLRLKADLSSSVEDLLSQFRYHTDQHIRSDMRLGIVSDTFLRTVLYHLFQHKVKPRIVDPGIELSIGKGPGSAFPELNIAAGMIMGFSPARESTRAEKIPAGPNPMMTGRLSQETEGMAYSFFS